MLSLSPNVCCERNRVNELVALLGPEIVFTDGHDSKAKIPIGSNIVQRGPKFVQKTIKLARTDDHDYAVAPGHKYEATM